MVNANFLAVIALLGVMASSLSLLVVKRPEETCIALLVAAFLFMPVGAGIKLPFMPLLDRDVLPYLCCFVTLGIRRRAWFRRNKLGRGIDLLFAGAMITGILTWTTNTDALTIGKYTVQQVQGLTFQDGLANIRTDIFAFAIPFVLGRLVMRGPAQLSYLLKALAVGGLVYTLPILIELRMSPQMHTWIYGHPARTGDFLQSVRGTGYRPGVFMPHGLALGIYMCIAFLAAAVLGRARQRVMRISWRPLAVYLLVILVACKSSAAIIYALAMLPLVIFTRSRTQMRVAAILAVFFLAYPVIRGANLFPAERLVGWAAKFSEERAQSLATRFESETVLLDKARSRIAFGWGGYGRPNVYNDYAQSIAIFDGFWITMLSHRGAVNLALLSLALAWPVLTLGRKLRKVPEGPDRLMAAGLALMMGISLIDLIPNGLFLNYPFFLSGALVGLGRLLPTFRVPARSQPAPAPPPAGFQEPTLDEATV